MLSSASLGKEIIQECIRSLKKIVEDGLYLSDISVALKKPQFFKIQANFNRDI